MKKLFFMMLVTVFMVMVSCEISAQSGFKVKLPNVQKYVIPTVERLNVRKTANTNSPIVATAERNWSNLVVIGESGDWYKVYYYSHMGRYEYTSAVGYVMKKYCSEIPLVPLQQNMLNNLTGGKIAMRTSGTYKGMYFFWERYSDDGMIENVLHIGKDVNGMLVFDRMLPMEFKGSGFQIVSTTEYKEYNIFNKILCSRNLAVWQNADEIEYFDANRLQDSQIAEILKNSSKMSACFSCLWLQPKGKEWVCLFYEPKDFGADLIER